MSQSKRTANMVRVPPQELGRRQTIRQALRDAGISIAAWSVEKGLNSNIVEAVLAGRLVGNHGEAHRVCVALGLKAGQVTTPAAFDPAAALREAA